MHCNCICDVNICFLFSFVLFRFCFGLGFFFWETIFLHEKNVIYISTEQHLHYFIYNKHKKYCHCMWLNITLLISNMDFIRLYIFIKKWRHFLLIPSICLSKRNPYCHIVSNACLSQENVSVFLRWFKIMERISDLVLTDCSWNQLGVILIKIITFAESFALFLLFSIHFLNR